MIYPRGFLSCQRCDQIGSLKLCEILVVSESEAHKAFSQLREYTPDVHEQLDASDCKRFALIAVKGYLKIGKLLGVSRLRSLMNHQQSFLKGPELRLGAERLAVNRRQRSEGFAIDGDGYSKTYRFANGLNKRRKSFNPSFDALSG